MSYNLASQVYMDLYPVLARKIKYTIIRANNEGLPIDLFCGGRSWEMQQKEYEKGRELKEGIWTISDLHRVVTNAQPGDSWHNYFVAGDFAFKDEHDDWTWDIPTKYWHRVAEIAKEVGLEWGLELFGAKLSDYPHFQYTKGLRIWQAKGIVKADGLKALWDTIEKEEVV